MKRKKLIWYLIGLVVGLVLYKIVNESLSQPTLSRFDGKYKELGFFRNENNTGPVLRIYAIRAIDPDTTWMLDFARSQPHTKYGRTLVFFFPNEVKKDIVLSSAAPYLPEEMENLVLARYEKTPMGEDRFSFNRP